MALEQALTDTLTQAIKAKDARTADVVRMIKTKIQERRTAKGSSGQVDDALVLDVICERYLPKTMDEVAVRALVRERIAALGIADPKQAGRLVGDIMKTHKGQVDAGDVKRVAEELLKG
jgi:uncharacterized protein YqeY